MTRSRDWALVAALALVLAVTGNVWPDGRKETAAPNESANKAGTELTCKFYSLGGLFARTGDPAIGEWLAQTIPQVIETRSWSAEGGPGTLRYYAHGKILIVNNEPAVQEKVRTFLDTLNNELPRNRKQAAKEQPATGKSAVVPARLTSPDQDPTLPAPDPAFQPQLVNEPARHYGHLLLEGVSIKENEFKLKKFSIMYRGEGLIDDTLAKLIKTLNKQNIAPMTPANDGPPRQAPPPPLKSGVKPTSPRPADSPATEPEDDEPTIGWRTLDKPERIPAPKKARRPTQSSKAKSTFVQSRYAPAPRLAGPDRPMVQVILPEEARHYAHLVVEGLTYSDKGVDLKKLSVVYRGDGIIDSNVAKVIKTMQGYAPRWSVEGMTLPSPMYLSSPPRYMGTMPPGCAP